MTNPKQFDDLIDRIGNDQRQIETVTTPARLFILLSQLQLAARVPGNNGSSAAIAREMADNMAEMICKFHPDARELIELGWQPAHDMTREEFDNWTNEPDEIWKDEPSRFPFVNEDDPNRPGPGDQI